LLQLFTLNARVSAEQMLRTRFERTPDDPETLTLADDWDFFIDGVSSPTDFLWAPCPYMPSPSPSSQPAITSDTGSVAVIVAPVILGTSSSSSLSSSSRHLRACASVRVTPVLAR
jgi:hypothetical protein